MNKILTTLLIYCLIIASVMAGLPPATSIVSGGTATTTFKTNYGSFTGTRSGTNLTLTGIGAASGASLVLGGSINANAILDVQSTTKAFMPPRLTTTQMNAIASPTSGMMVYNTDFTALATYNGSIWTYGFANLNLDNVYSGTVDASCSISGLNVTGWVASCTGTTSKIITFKTGLFTVAPNCWVTSTAGAPARVGTINPASTSVFSVLGYDGSTSVSLGFSFACQKSGTDYLSASSSVYSQQNANYDWTTFTPVLSAGFGSPTVTNACKHKRNGGMLDISCSFQMGTTAASLATITLPNSLALDSTKIIATNTTSGAGQVVGKFCQAASASCGSIVTATGTSTTLLYISSGFNGLAPVNGSTALNSTVITDFEISVPISGWTNAPFAVLSLAGTPNTPGNAGLVDSFSVSYGTTNATTVCSANPCSFLLQDGTAIGSVGWTSAGLMTLNTSATYSKLFCTGNAVGAVASASISPISCTSCNTATFNTYGTVSGTNQNTYGTLRCTGTR